MTIKLYMPEGGEAGVIVAFTEKAVVEFRGTPYSKWEEGESSDFYKVHSAIKRVDISRIHCGEVEVCTTWHGEEYIFIKKMFEEAQKCTF